MDGLYLDKDKVSDSSKPCEDTVNLSGILFDLDDTLVAFDAVTSQSWKEVCLEYSAAKPTVNPDTLLAAIKKVSDWYWSDPERHRIGRNNILPARREILKEVFLTMDLPEADADAMAERYSRVRLENMYILPATQSTLSVLRSRGYRLGLLTNGDGETQRYKIERFDLGKYFETILIEGELGFGKPDLRIYRLALSALGLEPEDACMIGDNLSWDVEAPQELGIRSIWIDRKGTGLPIGSTAIPHRVIRDISEVPAIFSMDFC
jgi:putative hydrolase of the HAD superfamily